MTADKAQLALGGIDIVFLIGAAKRYSFVVFFANARTLGVSDKHALRTESDLTAFPLISLKRWPEMPELYPPGCYLAPFRDAGAVIVPRLR